MGSRCVTPDNGHHHCTRNNNAAQGNCSVSGRARHVCEPFLPRHTNDICSRAHGMVEHWNASSAFSWAPSAQRTRCTPAICNPNADTTSTLPKSLRRKRKQKSAREDKVRARGRVPTSTQATQDATP